MPLSEAVVDAGAVRFRPMLLTALAVVVGASVNPGRPDFSGPDHFADGWRNRLAAGQSYGRAGPVFHRLLETTILPCRCPTGHAA
jgi:hypothetical protein